MSVTSEEIILPDGWTEVDRRAVDTVRVLAADAVQKVGNGHPGTAMSLAPVAYLLFQKVMRHNPAEPHWPGRDRFVLSCGHSSITLYIQLYLGGWGLELDDLKSLRTWLQRSVYAHGAELQAEDIIEAATGERLDAEPFFRRLEQRVAEHDD